MNALNNWKVSNKLLLAFSFTVLIMIIIGIGGILALSTIAKMSDISYKQNTLVIEHLIQSNVELTQVATAEKNLLLAQTPEAKERYKARIQTFKEKVIQELDIARPLITTDEGRRYLHDLDAAWLERQQVLSQIIELVDRGDAESHNAAFAMSSGIGRQKAELVEKALHALVSDKEETARSYVVEITATYHRNLILMLCLMACGVLYGFGASQILNRSIVQPMEEVCEGLRKFANKDLSVAIESSREDELGILSRHLTHCVASIRDVIGNIQQNSKTLSDEARSLNGKARQTKDNADVQTSKTNQIAAATQEMTATIREIGSNIDMASQNSRATSESATDGGQLMQQATKAIENLSKTTAQSVQKMNSLSDRSREIGQVITTIQEISEQTNLLALNAAIEAARAGEAGRGFAVVAGEVRRLAERTKSATNEISATIQSIQGETAETLHVMQSSNEEVDAGIQAIERANSGLSEIIRSTQDMDSLIQLIVAAVTEQTAAAGEIAQGAHNIAGLSGENAQVAAETSESCSSLADLAKNLQSIVDQFSMKH